MCRQAQRHTCKQAWTHTRLDKDMSVQRRIYKHERWSSSSEKERNRERERERERKKQTKLSVKS